MSNVIDVVKATSGMVSRIGVTCVVNTVINNLTPVGASNSKRTLMTIGGMAISSAVGSAVEKNINDAIDEVVEGVKTIKYRITGK